MLRSIRFALRQLRNSPGFAITVGLTLGLGIGATTTIFSVLDAVLLEPLPFSQPDRLVALSSFPWTFVSIPTVESWQKRSHAFRSIAAFSGWSPTVRSSRGREMGQVTQVTQNFLTTLGAGLALGHDFTRTGNERDCFSQIIVSGAYWKALGGGSTLGDRTLELDRRTFQIIGVLPLSQEIEGYDALNRPEILVPIGCNASDHLEDRGSSNYQAIGRLFPGVTPRKAALDLNIVQRSLTHDFPGDYPPSYEPVLLPFKDLVAGTGTRSALMETLAACALLLLIACANLANLLLARNTRRRQEFATRATLGASFTDLLGQLMVESAVLTLIGSLAGLALAGAAIRAFRQLTVLHLPRLEQAALHPQVLAFATAVCVLVTVLLTLLPAWRTLQPGLLTELAQRGRAVSSSLSLRRMGRVLVTAQITLALVLVACAGWMVSSVYTLIHQPLGFAPDHLLMASVDVLSNSVDPVYNAAHATRFFDQAAQTLRRLPGVEAVAAVNHYPLGGYINRYTFCSDAHPEQCHQYSDHSPDDFHITPGYFATIRQTLYRGRDFTDVDDGRNHVAIVNQALAAQEWPGQDPLGRRIFSDDIKDWATVVGVVGNVRNFDLTSVPVPNLYFPEADNPQPAMTFLLRTSGDPALLTETVRRVIRMRNPELTLTRLQTMEGRMSRQVALRRFCMWLAAGFGGLALFLAILGTYGLLAYEVSVREKEIGIRIALGSSREAIVRLLLLEESRWVLLGGAVGLFGSAFTGYLLRAQFYQPGAASMPVLGASALLLIVPSLMAIALPARRAAHLDPVQTLRRE